MTTLTKHLSLIKPTPTDAFSTADIASNWESIDTAPGVHICTSTTRPTWTTSQKGRMIRETDTGLLWNWSGTTWERQAGKGILTRSDGSAAVQTRTTDFSTTSSTAVLVAGISNVVVPPGNRTLLFSIMWSRAYATNGYFYGRAYHHSGGTPASNSGTRHMQWAITGAHKDPDGTSKGGLGTANVWYQNGLPAGTYGFSFQVLLHGNDAGNTATVTGSPDIPLTLAVAEL